MTVDCARSVKTNLTGVGCGELGSQCRSIDQDEGDEKSLSKCAQQDEIDLGVESGLTCSQFFNGVPQRCLSKRVARG